MKTKYLWVFACLLMVACDSPIAKNNEAPPENPLVNESSESTEPAESSANVIPIAKIEPKTPAGKMEATLDRFNAAMTEFREAFVSATKEEKQKVYTEKYPKPEEYAAEIMQIAEDYPESETAPEALLWVAQRSRGDLAAAATERLLANYIESEELAGLCQSLQYGDLSKKTIRSFEQMLEKSPHDKVKAAASVSLAKFYGRIKTAQAGSLGHPVKEKRLGKETVAFLKEFEVDNMTIESLYQSVIDEFADLKPREKSPQTYRDIAEGSLFEMNNLQIGCVAPDIEGEDLDGETFKLSDYRGKVVVIDFWGDW